MVFFEFKKDVTLIIAVSFNDVRKNFPLESVTVPFLKSDSKTITLGIPLPVESITTPEI
jgi:hypothetical protein